MSEKGTQGPGSVVPIGIGHKWTCFGCLSNSSWYPRQYKKTDISYVLALLVIDEDELREPSLRVLHNAGQQDDEVA